jgi:serralysin
VVGADRDDFLRGEDGNDYIVGGAGNDDALGEAGSDQIFGGAGDDEIDGGAGGDILVGEGGADRLIGAGGADWLVGGEGADTFRYLAASDSTVAAYDVIADFETGRDRVDLTAVRTGDLDRLIVEAFDGYTLAYVDQGGDGTLDLAILIEGPAVAGDFLF